MPIYSVLSLLIKLLQVCIVFKRLSCKENSFYSSKFREK